MSNGIGKNPLNDISAVYLSQIAEKRLDPVGQEDKDIDNDGDVDSSDKYLHKRRKAIGKAISKQKVSEGVRDLDPEKGTKERKARLEKKRGMKLDDHPQYKKEEVEQVAEADSLAAMAARREKRLARQRKQMGTSSTGQDFGHDYGISSAERKKRQQAEFDKFVGKKTTKEEVEAVAEDSDPCWDSHKMVGMKKKGGKMVPNCVPKTRKESFSDWRSDLREVMGSEEHDKEVTEKKVKNKIIINPEMKESVEEIGGTLLESVEMNDLGDLVDSVYDELLEEGYVEDDIEEVIEWALTEATVTYGSDTESPRDAMKKKVKGRLKFLGRKAREKASEVKKAAKYASAKAQVAAYNKGRNVAQTAGDKTRKLRKAVKDAPKNVKSGIKAKIKSAAEKVVNRMSEDVELDENRRAAQSAGGYKDDSKKQPDPSKDGFTGVGNLSIDAIRKMSARIEKRTKKESYVPGKPAERLKTDRNMFSIPKDEQKAAKERILAKTKAKREKMEEGLSIDQQMKISRDAAKDRNPNPDHKAIRGKMLKKPLPKDTRTDAQKMTDATGPRPGSRYRGD